MTKNDKEMLQFPNYRLLLVNTGLKPSFISGIELRPLKNTSYVTESGSLALSACGCLINNQ
jgi:hypothetical protein